jgi:hypothetical protein
MRFAHLVAFARALLALVFSIAFIVVPEQLMPGSSLEPARSLALLFVSRNLMFAVGLTVLSARRLDRPLGWLLLADVALQTFDAAYAHDASSIVPVIIGVLEALAARQLLLRSGKPLGG